MCFRFLIRRVRRLRRRLIILFWLWESDFGILIFSGLRSTELLGEKVDDNKVLGEKVDDYKVIYYVLCLCI